MVGSRGPKGTGARILDPGSTTLVAPMADYNCSIADPGWLSQSPVHDFVSSRSPALIPVPCFVPKNVPNYILAVFRIRVRICMDPQ